MAEETEQEEKVTRVREMRASPATTAAARLIRDSGLASPSRPDGYGAEYDFPDDVAKLSTTELGSLRLKLSRLHGYALRILAQEDNKLSPLEEVFILKRDLTVADVTRSWTGRAPAVEILRAVAIDSDPQLADLQQRIIILRAGVNRLHAQISIYDRHLQDLSREQSRRSDEAQHFA